jgi:hypothetical protein
MRLSRRACAAAAAAALVAAGVATLAADSLASRLPAEVPSSSVLATWGKDEGSYLKQGAEVRYALYVEPERLGLYRLTHYRVAATDDGGHRTLNEIVIWNAHPGSGERLHCFRRESYRPWWTLWLWRRWTWRAVPPGGPEYKAEMQRAIEIYFKHREAEREAGGNQP